MEASSGRRLQPSERERPRFDVAPPEYDPEEGATFSSALRTHWRLMAAIIGGLVVLAIGYGVVRTPNYTAETRLAVGGLNASTPSALTGFSAASASLAETYSRSVQGDAVVRDVAKELKTTPVQVRPHLNASPVPQTPVFTVTATTTSSATSIDMSRLASEALVREANRASDATPGRLLKKYEQAETQREQAEKQVAEVSQGVGSGSLAEARSALLAAQARADSLRKSYVSSEQGGSVPLEIIRGADTAASDRSSKMQMLVFVALVVGFIISSAVAVFLQSSRYPTFEESTLGRWELARRNRAKRARARRDRE
jgi:capsular polysaccharide biosynthesis protein